MPPLVFLIEEPSMQTFLEGARPRLPIPGDTKVIYRVAGGYHSMRQLVATTLHNTWPPGTRFVVLCDKDKADCIERKADLVSVIPPRRRREVLVRIVCYELESWYFGDPDTLSHLFPNFRLVRRKARFRNPDTLQQPSTQLMKLTGHRKRQLAEKLGPILQLETNRSQSLLTFLTGLQRLLSSSSTDATRSN